MNTKLYYRITSVIFLIIALGHLARSIYGWEAVVAGIEIPLYFSWIAVLVAGYLSYRGFTSKRGK